MNTKQHIVTINGVVTLVRTMVRPDGKFVLARSTFDEILRRQGIGRGNCIRIG